MKTTSIAVVLLAALGSACVAHTQTPATATDATWVRAYALPSAHPSAATDPQLREGALRWDPRLAALLKHSLPQQESWWVNGYGGSAPVSSIVLDFIGVPQGIFLDDNRYVTASGCVAHDCPTNGMLWIDTGTQPATVAFVAEVSIESFKGGAGNHLWLYSSKKLNFTALPPDLLTSISRWHNSVDAQWHDVNRSYKGIFSPHVSVATLVQPNGRMQDLTYDMLFYKQNAIQYPTPGVKP